MTLQRAAEAHFDQQTNRAWRSWPEHQRLDAVQDFIAGAEWALEKAAREAEAVGDYYPVDLWPAITSAHYPDFRIIRV